MSVVAGWSKSLLPESQVVCEPPHVKLLLPSPLSWHVSSPSFHSGNKHRASPSKWLWHPVLLAASQTRKLALMALVKKRVLFFPQEWAICHEPQIQIVGKTRAAHTSTFSGMSSFSTHKFLQLDLFGFFWFFKLYRFLMVF